MHCRNRVRQSLIEFGCDEASNSLCRWIHTIKRRCFVEVPVTKRRDRFGKQTLDQVEITEQFLAIELTSRDRNHDAPVVPVEPFTRTAEKDCVCSRKLTLNL